MAHRLTAYHAPDSQSQKVKPGFKIQQSVSHLIAWAICQKRNAGKDIPQTFYLSLERYFFQSLDIRAICTIKKVGDGGIFLQPGVLEEVMLEAILGLVLGWRQRQIAGLLMHINNRAYLKFLMTSSSSRSPGPLTLPGWSTFWYWKPSNDHLFRLLSDRRQQQARQTNASSRHWEIEDLPPKTHTHAKYLQSSCHHLVKSSIPCII